MAREWLPKKTAKNCVEENIIITNFNEVHLIRDILFSTAHATAARLTPYSFPLRRPARRTEPGGGVSDSDLAAPPHPTSPHRTGRRAVPTRAAPRRSLSRAPCPSTSPTMLRELLLLAACVPALRAFPDGAPAEACISGMKPNHSGAGGRSHQHAPFAVLRHTSHGQVTGEG